jgi:hypothetical protein
MSIQLYENQGDSTPYSSGTFTNAFLHNFDGRIGGIHEVKIFVRNDDSLHVYEDISMSIEQFDTLEIDFVGGDDGFSFKLFAGDTQPTSDEWSTINYAIPGSPGEIDLSDLTDTNTWLPVWIRIEIPASIPVQRLKTVRFKVSATESDV